MTLPPASSIHSQIEAERKAAVPNARDLSKYRAYARGRQRGTLTAGQQRILRGLIGNLFCDNVCAMVLQQISNRILLTRYEVVSDDTAAVQAQEVETFLRTVWTLNQLPALSAAVQYATIRDGNHCVGLGWLNGRVTLSREKWWNGKNGIFVAYDANSQPAYAVKEWQTPQGLRRTIWYDDRIERYLASGEGWRMINLDSDGVPQTESARLVPWLHRDGDPLGIPIVHFAKKADPSDSDDTQDAPSVYGVSELDGGILGLQDEINDVQRDISAAARFTAYQMYYATGVTQATDENGSAIKTFSVEPGALWEEENAAARFGTLAAGSLVELQRTLQIKHEAVSRASSVPQHAISGDWPSGEALIRAERPLIDKAEAIARVFGPAWASIAHKATRIANTFARLNLNEQLLITSVFAPPERRDPLTRSTIAATEAPFVSRRQTLRTLGYSPDEQDRILAEMDEDAAKGLARAQAMVKTQPTQQQDNHTS